MQDESAIPAGGIVIAGIMALPAPAKPLISVAEAAHSLKLRNP